MIELETRPIALITGASSGIGLELAKQFADNNYDLIITADDIEIETAAEQLRKTGRSVKCVQVDLRTYSGVQELYQTTQSTDRPIDVAVLNAGVGTAGDFAREVSLEESLSVVELNVTANVHLAKLLLKDMAEKNHGKMMFTSSVEAFAPSANQAVYAASKAFLNSFTDALRVELKDTKVQITTLMPGLTHSKFFDRAGITDTFIGGTKMKDDPADVACIAFRDLTNEKERSIPLVKNKIAAFNAAVMPKKVVSRIYKKLSERGSYRQLTGGKTA